VKSPSTFVQEAGGPKGQSGKEWRREKLGTEPGAVQHSIPTPSVLWQYPKLGHDCFLPHLSQFNNLLNSSSVTLKILHGAHIALVCFVWISEHTATFT
jgi:hypothetical protein